MTGLGLGGREGWRRQRHAPPTKLPDREGLELVLLTLMVAPRLTQAAARSEAAAGELRELQGTAAELRGTLAAKDAEAQHWDGKYTEL